MHRMGKVLVVDDSALMRRLLGGMLSDAGWDVQTARNGVEGVERLTDWAPDVVTLDINMPEMDGLTALSLMMQARPTPVVMVSSLTARGAQATFEALALGAVDYVAKPGGTISLNADQIAAELLAKVQAARRARLRGRAAGEARPVLRAERPAPRAPQPLKPAVPPPGGRPDGLVLVGVSTGGPRTLEDVLPQLPADFAWPVIVAQHMPANFTSAFAQRMDGLCALNVREVDAPMPLETGHVYIGRGGSDVLVAEKLGRLVVQPRPESPAHPWHPSVDLLVESAMAVMPAPQLVGVQLTGMGYDGARTMAELRRRGGRTVAESEDSAVVFGMPQELIALGGASVVLPSTQVARQLCSWVGRRAGLLH